MVVTEGEAEKINEEWSIVHGTHDQYLKVKRKRATERARLRKQFGREPSESDVQWAMLKRQLGKEARQNDWGLYRNTRYQMAEIVRKEKKMSQALAGYLEVCYLDLNGPNNIGGYSERLLASENVKGFDPAGDAFLAPAIVGRIGRLAKKLKMGREALQATFIEHNRTIENSLDLPLSPQTCWEKLAQELFKDC